MISPHMTIINLLKLIIHMLIIISVKETLHLIDFYMYHGANHVTLYSKTNK
jgi:uncharacterized protein YqhQ